MRYMFSQVRLCVLIASIRQRWCVTAVTKRCSHPVQGRLRVGTTSLTSRNHSRTWYAYTTHAGGPSLGDIRSRLVRLAAIAMTHRDDSCLSQPHSREALYALLMHRLPLEGSSRAIKQEWMDILEGKHKLWRGIDPEKRECVRGFLVQFESDVLHRAHRNFNFRGGSIGNFFLVAMQRFFRSIQSAIFLFSALVGIQPALPDCRILPAINTNRTVTIAALLENGESIVGQCEISHPSVRPTANVQEFISSHVSTRQPSPEATPSASVHNLQQLDVISPSKAHEQLVSRSIGMQGGASDASSAHSMDETEFGDDDEDKDGHSDSDNEALGNLAFSKLDEGAVLQSPISRTSFANTGIYYVNVCFFFLLTPVLPQRGVPVH